VSAGGNPTDAAAALDRWAQGCERTCAECERAELLLVEGDGLRAREHVTRARETAWNLYRSLLEAGAAPVEGAGVPAPLPLRLFDTPATRRLLQVLRAAQEAAEAVDAERGHILPGHIPLQPGESRGTGWAESVSNLAERLRVEVEGPRGRE
jgi:hypothetical protein